MERNRKNRKIEKIMDDTTRVARGLIAIQLFLVLFLMGMVDLFGLPDAVTYSHDIVTLLLLVCCLLKGLWLIRERENPCDKYVVGAIALFTAVVMVSAFINAVPFRLFIWAVRNTYRYFVMFFACIFFLNPSDIEKSRRPFLVIYFVNFAIMAVQFAMGLRNDYVGGIFGCNIPCNTYTNIFVCLVLIWVICRYMEGKCGWRTFTAVMVSAMVIAAMAELKVFYIEFILIVAGILVLHKNRENKKKLLGTALLSLAVGLLLLYLWYPTHFKILTNYDSLHKYVAQSEKSEIYYINRIGAFGEINKLFFGDSVKSRWIGLGFGSCEASNAAIFTSDFYLENGWMHYRYFVHQMLYLETGYLGFVSFILIFVSMMTGALKAMKKGKNYSDALFGVIFGAVVVLNLWYNYGIRNEIAYLTFAALAVVQIVNQKQKGTDELENSANPTNPNNKSLNIAMIGQKLVPSRRGGIELVLTTICPMLVERGHRVTCYNRYHAKTAENEYQGTVEDRNYLGVRIKHVPTIKKRGLAAVTSSFFASVCAAFGRYDIIHYHAEGPAAMLWIPKLFGKRCVVTIHGLDWKREKWKNGFGSRYIKLGEKVLSKYADEIIVLSRNVQEYFQSVYGREAVLIPNGVSPAAKCLPEQIKTRYGLTGRDYYLSLGRLADEKGIHYLIEAYQKLRTDKKLIIAGAASDTDDYVSRLKKQAEGNLDILFVGFVSGRLLEELYSNAYAYVFPSTLEGMPLSLLEAMSYGNAVVASDIPEIREIVEDRAVVFRSRDAEDLKEKLQLLEDQPQLAEQCRQGVAEFISRKCNWETIVDQTIQVYRKI